MSNEKNMVVGEGQSKVRFEREPLLDLFDRMLPPHSPYTNSFALYDLAPKHVFSVTQEDWRDEDKQVLRIKERTFEQNGTLYELVITPARLFDKDGNEVDVYPGRQEQNVEEALRRLAVKRASTMMINNEPGVRFTLYELRAELKEIGSTLSLQEIKWSIEVCHKCTIAFRRPNDTETDCSAPIFPSRALGKIVDGDFVSYVTFHPLVAMGINRLQYRLLNYNIQVRFKSYVSKWLHKRLSHHFTQGAAADQSMLIHASDVIRNSGMTLYSQWRDNIGKVREAVRELKDLDVLISFESEAIKGPGGSIKDEIFNLYPSGDFLAEMRKANSHQNKIEDEAEKRDVGPSARQRRKRLSSP